MKLLNRINFISESRKHQSIEGYIAALRKLAKTCNFDKLEERLIRDQVVVGVREEGLRQKLLEDKQLTLDKCMSIGRAY